MYIAVNKRRYQGKHKKIYESVLLRESYREGGKVKHRTIANLSNAKPEEIEAIRLALKYKDNIESLVDVIGDVEIESGLSVGSVYVLNEVAKRLGIAKALGDGREGKVGLWQVIARILDQGSRLSAVRLMKRYEGCDVIGIKEGFNEEDLYKNLEWLYRKKVEIEKKLWKGRKGLKGRNLFLYDVTSSYLEGEKNFFGEYGYSRDKKRGKKQIVIGLLCDGEGYPVSVDVYNGNTLDFRTFYEQVEKVVKGFGCEEVTFVGDRGMIKKFQTKDLPEGCYYITAITKPEIESLVKKGKIQLGLFDEDICEVIDGDERYILRRNPYRKDMMKKSRLDKKEKIMSFVEKQNRYLMDHPCSKVEVAIKRITQKLEKFNLEKIYHVEAIGRTIIIQEEEESLKKAELLDGCYVIKTNLSSERYPAPYVHERYKDLSLVEQGFRTMKSEHLEVRPVYVRRKESTIGHCFIVMLAYMITRYLKKAWSEMDVTVQEGLNILSGIVTQYLKVKGKKIYQKIPNPNEEQKRLLDILNISLPKTLPSLGTKVATRKKLPSRRKK